MIRARKKAGLPSVCQFGFCIALTLCWVLTFSFPSYATEFTGKVVGVKDGDSLVVRQYNGSAIEIRLWGIDAP